MNRTGQMGTKSRALCDLYTKPHIKPKAVRTCPYLSVFIKLDVMKLCPQRQHLKTAGLNPAGQGNFMN